MRPGKGVRADSNRRCYRSDVEDNPFERYGLDPRDGLIAITQKLRELAEDATDEAERERIRATWDELTLHPEKRVRAALFVPPRRTDATLEQEPRPRRRRTEAAHEWTLVELTARVRIEDALPPSREDRAEDWLDDPLLSSGV